MVLTTPKRLFHIPSMSTVLYENVDGVNKYACVSHVWGDLQMFTAAELGIASGVDWIIPLSNPNKICKLVDAMNHYEMEYCWFDVLCMPQDEQNEINKEVSLMGDYYSGAEITLVLSDDNYTVSYDDFARWSDMMDDIITKKRRITEEEHKWICSHTDDNILDISEEVWFKRLWTLQETVLSKEIILVSKENHIGLSDVLGKLSCMIEITPSYTYDLFAKSGIELVYLIDVIESYNSDSFQIVDASNQRDCYRPQDRFYGTLGILGYKDFPVDYGITMEDLNEKIIRHAFSKGDISWIAIGGDKGDGFIQPIHKKFASIGEKWKEEETGSCGIVFEDKTLYMNTYSFATVIRREKFVDHSDDEMAILGWLVRMFRDWGFSDDDIVHAATGFFNMSENGYEVTKMYLDCLAEGMVDPEQICAKIVETFDPSKVNMHKCMREMGSNIVYIKLTFDMQTIVMARLNETGENIPLVITGNASVGDEIGLLRMYDETDRCLGIVCNSGEREGIFLYKRVDIPHHLYTPYKFLL